MRGNRSLDEFAGNTDERSAAAAAVDDGEGDEPVAADPPAGGATTGDDDGGADAAATVDPVMATFAWSPTGGPCAGCGGTVERRWRDGEDLVCVDCKDW